MSHAHAPGRTFYSMPILESRFVPPGTFFIIASTPRDPGENVWMALWRASGHLRSEPELAVEGPGGTYALFDEALRDVYARSLRDIFDPVIARRCQLWFDENAPAGEGPFASPDIGPTTVCLDCDAIIPVAASYHKRTDETFVLCEACFQRWESAGRAKEKPHEDLAVRCPAPPDREREGVREDR